MTNQNRHVNFDDDSELTTITELPNDLACAIGRVIYSFSVLEDKLKSLAYALCGFDHRLGRLVVREPRAPELFDIIRTLLDWNRLEGAPPKELDRMRKNIELTNSRRDALAHCVICEDKSTNKHHILETRGSWKPTDGLAKPGDKPKGGKKPRVRRAIRPTAPEITVDNVQRIQDAITPLIQAVDQIGEALNKWNASQRKQP